MKKVGERHLHPAGSSSAIAPKPNSWYCREEVYFIGKAPEDTSIDGVWLMVNHEDGVWSMGPAGERGKGGKVLVQLEYSLHHRFFFCFIEIHGRYLQRKG